MRQLEIDALVATWTDFCTTASLLLGSVDYEHHEPRHTMHTSAPKNHNPEWHDLRHTFRIERELSSPALDGQLLPQRSVWRVLLRKRRRSLK